MKLSFSTLGCPNWDLNQVIKNAKNYGFDGVEIRGIKDQLDVSKLPEFTIRAGEIREKFGDAEIEIICFSSSIRMAEPDKSKRNKHFDELKRYAELCYNFDTPFIRIFGGEIGELSWEKAIEEAAETLTKMIEIIKDVDSKIVIETHDDWMAADHHTHWKDSKIAIDTVMGFEPCLVGEGDLPHEQIYNELKKGGYDGYLSLEWEKRWHQELPDPEIAFPQYFSYMKNLMDRSM